MLVDIFLEEAAHKSRAPKKSMAPEALSLLCQYAWPGNVRELKNLIERLVIMISDKEITAAHLPKPYNPGRVSEGVQAVESLFALQELKTARQLFEHYFIRRKLTENENNITHTAKCIGVERSYLHRRIKRLEKDKF